MATFANMGPWRDVTPWSGSDRLDAVPVFIDKLPMTSGGVAGEDLYFGRAVFSLGSDPDKLYQHLGAQYRDAKGNVLTAPVDTSGAVVRGIIITNPEKMMVDVAMSLHYFETQFADFALVGPVEVKNFDISNKAPSYGSQVFADNLDGHLIFVDSGDAAPSNATKLNVTVYDLAGPNGAKLWINIPIVTTVAKTRAATPTATPAAGTVVFPVQVTLESATAYAKIYYTVDGTNPTSFSPIYSGPISLSAAATIKAIAATDDGKLDPSTMFTAAYSA